MLKSFVINICNDLSAGLGLLLAAVVADADGDPDGDAELAELSLFEVPHAADVRARPAITVRVSHLCFLILFTPPDCDDESIIKPAAWVPTALMHGQPLTEPIKTPLMKYP